MIKASSVQSSEKILTKKVFKKKSEEDLVQVQARSACLHNPNHQLCQSVFLFHVCKSAHVTFKFLKEHQWDLLVAGARCFQI